MAVHGADDITILIFESLVNSKSILVPKLRLLFTTAGYSYYLLMLSIKRLVVIPIAI